MFYPKENNNPRIPNCKYQRKSYKLKRYVIFGFLAIYFAISVYRTKTAILHTLFWEEPLHETGLNKHAHHCSVRKIQTYDLENCYICLTKIKP